ncbi:sulfatase-like hydrolase/transferase [Micromonospora sp. DR5-3]|uniref:sulfatase-like hydrolase/transferase n=1 Tax=unclassified Micromonospora TaxID=2617518 RepID=UPI0011D45AF2|nr:MULTISPECIES: sulfatase-like hydrolase/transferase [unclassified Micromonospora]MCW3815973.1 sulfatase-like hydrolase/transferase [Micromonospora sp. DR5-3]TYC20836.1 sulfatase-like hydrolase/transferase [Micromonospora sp. MP36]
MASRDPQRPNILFILSDDQGPWAMGCAGNEEIQTPRLDSLAASGTRLDNFFCTSPVCSPARASLFTGQIPSRHGVHDYLDGVHVGPGAVDYLAGQRLFTDELAEAGYRLGLTGKWHLGANDRPRPGFVHWYAHESGGSPYYGASMYRGGRPETVHGYLTDVLAEDAGTFLRAEVGRPEPFYLSLHFTAPHKPWRGQHPPEVESVYRDCAFASCPQEPWHPWLPLVAGVPIGGEADTRAALVGYFAAVTAMDSAIGRLLDRLDELGLIDSTLVMFSSDNGFNAGHHGIWGKGNGTYPQNMYDTSVKVPAIVAQPGRIVAGQVRHELLSAYDVGATLLELAGLDARRFEQGPGRSFAGLLTGPNNEGDVADRPIVVYDEYGPVRMIRTAEWKYVHRYPDGPHELYDLVRDPDERVNRVDEPDIRDIVRGMRADLDGWFTEHADPSLDGRRLPVVGAGQVGPVGLDPYGAFQPPGWDMPTGP